MKCQCHKGCCVLMWLRWVELVVVFACLPVLVFFFIKDIDTWLMPMLGATGVVCLFLLLRDSNFKRFRLWFNDNSYRHLRASLLLFIPTATLTSLLIYWLFPELFLALPKQNPELWLITLLIYPLVSVIPQEIIFRTYFFHRYKGILPSKTARWGLSSFAFGFAHLVYGNWVAVVFSWIAGGVFGYRYMHSRSTSVVIVEHTLWGSFVFTIGMGAFFLTQAV